MRVDEDIRRPIEISVVEPDDLIFAHVPKENKEKEEEEREK